MIQRLAAAGNSVKAQLINNAPATRLHHEAAEMYCIAQKGYRR